MHGQLISSIRSRLRPLSAALFATALAGLLPLAAPLHAADADPNITLRVGVLTTEGATRALEAWTPTIDRLNAEARTQGLGYDFTVAPQTHAEILRALQDGGLDFLLTDPASFVTAEVEAGARPILASAQMADGRTVQRTGAVIFARSDSRLRSITELDGRRVMAVAPNDFAGWWLAKQEFRKRRLDPESTLDELVFSGGNQRDVVYAVQTGLVDAGVVSTGVLESLAQEGAITLQDFVPISAMSHDGFPFWSSTPLYPEWVLSALPQAPESALSLVLNTLLSVSPDSPESMASGHRIWQAPQNYQSVHDLLISLRVRPYENYIMQAALRVFRSYQLAIIGVAALIILSLAFLVFQLRRSLQLAEARRNVLESEDRSKTFYRSAIEEHTIFTMLARDGAITHVNRHLINLIGHNRQTLGKMHLQQLLSDEARTQFDTEILAALEDGKPWTGALRLLGAGGDSLWLQCSFMPVPSPVARFNEIAVIATDVTKTRKGASEERFQNTLELIADQIVVLRPGTLEMLHCNKAAAEKLVRRRIGGEWKNRKVSDFITGDDFTTLRDRCAALVAGPQRRTTWEVATRLGVTYEISLEYAQPAQDEPRLIAVYRDITERKVAERAKNEFIATVSHELRTPLTSIKGALGLALSGALGEMPEKMNRVVGMAGSNCDRLVTLINDILDLVKVEAGKMDFKMEELDMAELVKASVEGNTFYGEKFGVRYRLAIDEDGGKLLATADRSRMRQVMDNLLSNAAKFSEKGSEVLVSAYRHQGHLRVSVRDYGSGIPEAAQPRIFEKFTQADSSDRRAKGGTGLGLSIAKLIVEEHQGRIVFVSREGSGTEFFVDLPLIGDDAEAHITSEAPTEFSDLPAAIGPALTTDEAMELLLDLSSAAAAMEYEKARVSAAQVAKGRGVVGQSTVLNWMNADARALMGDLAEAGVLSNRMVSVLEITQSDEAKPLLSLAGLLADWMSRLEETESAQRNYAGWRPRLAGVASADTAAMVEQVPNMIETADREGALALVQDEAPDFLAHLSQAHGADVLTLFPSNTKVLPLDMPVLVVALKTTRVTTERGKVTRLPHGAAAAGLRTGS